MIHVKVPDTRVCSIIPLSHYLFSVLPKNFSNPEELWVTCLQGLSDSWDLNLKDELMDIEELHFLITLWKTKQSYLLLQLGFYIQAPAAAAKSLQLCPTLCNPIEGSPPGSAIPGILQARTLEWVAISFSNAWKWKWSRSIVSDFSDPMDCSLPGFSVHGIFQARVLEWGAIAFSIYLDDLSQNEPTYITTTQIKARIWPDTRNSLCAPFFHYFLSRFQKQWLSLSTVD